MPSLAIYEMFKRVLQQRDERVALRAAVRVRDVHRQVVREPRLIGRLVDQHVEDRRGGVLDDLIVEIVAVVEVTLLGHEVREFVAADPDRLRGECSPRGAPRCAHAASRKPNRPRLRETIFN